MLIIFSEYLNEKREKERGRKKFFINVPDEIAGLTPTYLWVWWRTQDYIVLGRKCLFIGPF